MKTRKEIQEWILENCVDEEGDIMLNRLNFKDKNVYLDGIKADKIYNFSQKAYEIYNNKQNGGFIYNYDQNANRKIVNKGQTSNDEINNQDQESKKIIT